MRSLCLLNEGPNYQREDFLHGLQAAGYLTFDRIDRPEPGDLLVIWNRTGFRATEANRFEAAGAKVLVVENGYLGKRWSGHKWFSMAWGHHSGAGSWFDGGRSRWDSWAVEMAPWRTGGTEVVILGQRGIGESGIAASRDWAEQAQRWIGGRIRPHPGTGPAVPLEEDLKDACAVVTWHSAAALQALLMGIPVFYGFDRWIGATAGRHLSEWKEEPKRDDEARLSMFRRLAWVMWTDEEVRSGEALRSMLCAS